VQAWGLTEVRWSPWYQARPELRVRVISADGSEHWVDGSTLDDAAVSQEDPTLFSDDRVMRTPLPGVGIGAVVEEAIVVRETRPFLAGGAVRQVPLANQVRTGRRRVVVEVAGDLPLRHRLIRADAQVRKLRGKKRRGIEVVLDDLPAWEGWPVFPPEDEPPWPALKFSTAPDWPEVARAYHDLVSPQIDAAGLDALVEEVAGAGPSRDEKVAAAYHVARDRVRYTGVAFGQQAIVPYAPATTIDRGFGDCKDKATLMVSLLAEVGVEARLALIAQRTEYGSEVVADMPGASMFNHAIVYVPGDDPLWLDPTADMVPFGKLPWADQGRLALVVDPVAGRLERIPTTSAGHNLYREDRKLALPPEGLARVTERTHATGWPALDLRWGFVDENPADVEEHLAAYGEEVYGAATMTGVTVENLDQYAEPFVLEMTYEDTEVGETSSLGATVWLDPSPALAHVPFVLTTPPERDDPLAERTQPFVYAPFRDEVSYEVVLPGSFVPHPPPESRVRRFGSATLEERFAVEEGTVRATWIFDSGDARLSPEEARALRGALLGCYEPVMLTWDEPGAVLLAAGRIRQALVHYDGLVEAHPDVGTYRSWVAGALVQGRLGDLALEEARRATEISPDVAAVWRVLGWVQMHDRYGNELTGRFDREGAIASTRHALELTPSDVTAQQNLAVLLEHPPSGPRYGPGADLEGAAGLYRARRAEGALTDLDASLLFTLLHLERYEEAARLGAETDRTVHTDGLRLAALVCARGAESALAEAHRWGWENADRLQVLDGARAVLVALRKYPEAAAVADASASIAANPMQAREVARTLRAVRPWEEVFDEHGDDPSLLILWLLAASREGAHHGLEVRDLLARDLWDPDRSAYIAGMTMQLRTLDLPLDSIIDIIIPARSVEQSGNERVGLRVDLQLRVGGEDGGTIRTYAVRERGSWRIRAMEKEVASLGREAWTRARRGDVEGARQWLAWAQAESRLEKNNPWAGTPLDQLWQETDDRRELRRLAAMLMAPAYPDDAIAELEPWRAETTAQNVGVQIDRAICAAAMPAERWEVALEAIGRMKEATPESRGPLRMEMLALAGAGRMDEALAAGDRLLQRFPSEGFQVAIASRMAGEQERSRNLLRQVIAGGNARPHHYNDLAWSLLFEPTDLEKAAEYAVRATTRSVPEEPSAHTLATVLAHRGEAERATEVLGLAMQFRTGDELEDHWWLVIGRIALEYGYADYAREAWARVPQSEEPLSPRSLADSWLRALDAAESESP